MNEEKEAIELKPCPFCGSKAAIYHLRKQNMYVVSCCADDSCFHGTDGVSEDWCPMDLETPEFATETEAIEVWNKRASLSPDNKQLTGELTDGNSAKLRNLTKIVGVEYLIGPMGIEILLEMADQYDRLQAEL